MWITTAKYAEHLGITPHMVRKHIKRGRIPAGAIRTVGKAGRNLEIHLEAADAALKKSCGKEPAVTKPAANKRKSGKKTLTDTEKAEVIKNAGLEDCTTLTDAQRMNQTYAAALKKQQWEENERTLIRAESVQREAFEVARQVRDTLLSIPGRTCAVLAAETDENSIKELLKTEIRGALEALSGT
jgi:hypothetical protein